MRFYDDEPERIEYRLLSERIVVCRKDHGTVKAGQHARKLAAMVDGKFEAWYEPLEPDWTDADYEEVMRQHREDAEQLQDEIAYEKIMGV